MPSVWETRFAEYVRRIAALREGTALELLPDLMPVLPVADPNLPELSLLRRERRCAAWNTVAAVAAQQGFITISNSAASGLLVVVEELLCFTAVGGAALAWRAQAGSLGGVVVTTRAAVDLRAGPCVTAVQTGTAAVAQPGLEYRQSTSGFPAAFGPWVLPPGLSFSAWAMTANVEVNFSVRLRERAVDPAELVPTGA